jgi:hypothetical protein
MIVKFSALETCLLAANRALPYLLEFDLRSKCLGVADELSNDRVLELLGDKLEAGVVLDLNDFGNYRSVRLSPTEPVNGIADEYVSIPVPDGIECVLQQFAVAPPDATLPAGEDVLRIHDVSPLASVFEAGIKLTVEASAIVLLIVSANATVHSGSTCQRRH